MVQIYAFFFCQTMHLQLSCNTNVQQYYMHECNCSIIKICKKIVEMIKVECINTKNMYNFILKIGLCIIKQKSGEDILKVF